MACRVLFQRPKIFTNRFSRSMSFFSERKIFRRRVTPLLESAFLRQLVESSIDLDSGETFRTKPEPLFLRRVAVEIVAPAFVIPTAGADVRFGRHRLERQSLHLFLDNF